MAAFSIENSTKNAAISIEIRSIGLCVELTAASRPPKLNPPPFGPSNIILQHSIIFNEKFTIFNTEFTILIQKSSFEMQNSSF